MPLADAITGSIRSILLVLLGGAGLLLLIACVNIASLLVVRAESRKREMGVRSALGASGSRLAGQFLSEGFVMVILGGTLGIVLAKWTMRLLTSLIPADRMEGMPFLSNLTLNVRVIAKRRNGLAEGSRGSASSLWRHVGTKLVVLELATAVVLLVGARACSAGASIASSR